MKKLHKKILGMCLGMLFITSGGVLEGAMNKLPVITASEIEEEADRRIVQLDQSLMKEQLPLLEEAIGRKIPQDSMPKKSFVVKWNFHFEGPRILNFITLLEQYIHLPESSHCLNMINEMFYLQFRQLLVEVNFGPKPTYSLGMPVANGFSRKTKSLDTLLKVYDCQNKSGNGGFICSYKSPCLGLIMTKLAINVFRTRAHVQKWKRDKQEDFLFQKIVRAKKQFRVALSAIGTEGAALSGAPSSEELLEFVDSLRSIDLGTKVLFPWGTVAKWTAAAAAVAAVVYGIYYVVNKASDGVTKISQGAGNFGRNAGEGAGDKFQQGAQTVMTEFRQGMREAGQATVRELNQNGITHNLSPRVEAAIERISQNGIRFSDRVEQSLERISRGNLMPQAITNFFDAARPVWFNGDGEGTLTRFIRLATDAWFTGEPGAFTRLLGNINRHLFGDRVRPGNNAQRPQDADGDDDDVPDIPEMDDDEVPPRLLEGLPRGPAPAPAQPQDNAQGGGQDGAQPQAEDGGQEENMAVLAEFLRDGLDINFNFGGNGGDAQAQQNGNQNGRLQGFLATGLRWAQNAFNGQGAPAERGEQVEVDNDGFE